MKPKFWCASALILLDGLALATSSAPPPAGFQANYRRVSTGSIVQDKNFYVLTLLQQSPTVRAVLAADPELAVTMNKKTVEQTRGIPAANDFKTGAQSAASSMMLSDEAIAAVRAILMKRFPASPALQALVNEHLRPSGTYQRVSGRSDAEMLGDAWAEAARGINQIIVRFALETDIHYEDIDSPSY